MRIHAGFLLAALLTASCAKAETPASDTQAAATPETPASDAKAIAIADQVMEGLGGKKHWESLRGIRWTFGNSVGDTVKSSRRHSWDKQTGWHRVSGKNRAGQAFVVIENLNDGKGMAWMEGNRIEGDSLAKLLTFAKRTWTNDTYWFLMPYKLRDPGVTLKYAGEAKEGDRAYDKIALSFGNVGQTPGDHYWVYVNRANHRVEKWEYVLQETEPPPKTWTWDDWEKHDGLWFCTAHRNTEGVNVFTREVETVREFRSTEFIAP
jgi:hypothetical protein